MIQSGPETSATACLARFFGCFEAGASSEQLRTLLEREVSDRFGLTARREDCDAVALRLHAWFHTQWSGRGG